MKSNKMKNMKKRLLALVLCMAMVMNGGISAVASDVAASGGTTEPQTASLDNVHVHTEECYVRTKVSEEPICGKEVIEGHVHGDACYEVTSIQELTCTLKETEGHSHGDGCTETVEVLTCTTSEHAHGDGCYTTEKELNCGQEESEEHTHDDGCYVESTECTCGTEEHSHGGDCYQAETNTICGLEEVAAHAHGEGCYTTTETETLICDLEAVEAHTHSDDCYEWTEELVCTIKVAEPAEILVCEVCGKEPCECTPVVCETCGKEPCECTSEICDECEKEPCECTSDELVAEAGETTITLLGSEEAFDAKKTYALQVNELEEETAAMVATAIKDAARTANLEVLDYQAFDITLTADEEDAQPKTEVEVKFTGAKIEEYIATEDAEVKAFYVDAEGNVEEIALTEGENEVVITTDHFSTYVVASVKNAEPVVLTTEADGTTITLSGPVSAFAEGKTYEITAAKVEAEEELEVIEEALEEVAEEQEKVVESYQVFDIKIIEKDKTGAVTNENFQPLNETPVQVMFSGNEVAESVENEETETNVIHVDTETGETTDMAATATEENDVAIETTHFSIYVVVDLESIGGEINVTLEHWATVKTIDGKGTNPENISAHSEYRWITEDSVYNREKEEINWINLNTQIYTTDTLVLPNNLKKDIEELSKICLASAGKSDTNKNYSIKEVWISNKAENQGKENWEDGTYTIYSFGDDREIKLTQNVLIRIIYEEKAVADTYWQDVEFYDHNVSNGNATEGSDKGTNTNANFTGTGSIKMGAGQPASGNKSAWADNASLNGRYLNKNGNVTPDATEKNKSGLWINTSIVGNELDENFNLIYNGSLKQPGFFEQGKTGTYYFNNYKLGFAQNGDTYILSTVKNVNTNKNVLTDLQQITQNTIHAHCFSNEFWPLDDLNYSGMDSRVSNASDDGKTHNWHFGMRYDFTFTVGDYTGPLNYYFRGDDDFWMFIDGKKVVDLGGIHSSIGYAVDLREWMEKEGMLDNPSERHRVSIYYMERGGFGSCCYMQFTLPNCTSVDVPEVEKTSVTVNKAWQSDYVPENIQVELVRTIGEIETVLETQTLSAANEWTYTWTGLPLHDVNNSSVRYEYFVREKNVPEGFVSSVTNTGTKQLGYTYTIKNVQIIDIPIEKIWNDQENKYNIRQNSVQMKLLANGNTVKNSEGNDWILTLNNENGWQGIWTQLPKCNENNELVDYTVQEVVVPDGYTVSYPMQEGLKPGDEGFKFTVTNNLNVKLLKLVKYDADDTSKFLSGAKFQLESINYPEVTYEEATTGVDGSINFGELPYGEYILTEAQAPDGYSLNEYHYHIVISETGVKAAKHVVNQEEPNDNQYVDVTTVENSEEATLVYVVEVANEKLYSLPSTGGIGTGIYSISGLALMSGAALILRKKKDDEEV